MNDVFVSYTSSDRDRVRPLVDAIEGAGWSVWWDREIGTGVAFDREIERALDTARCVVVVWSAAAVESEWVRAEAHDALERRNLVPVAIDSVRPPLAFLRLQTLAFDPGDAGSIEAVKRAIAVHVPNPADAVEHELADARDAYGRHDWETAYTRFASCDKRRALAAADLERAAWTAYWTARYDETLVLFERAEASHRQVGDTRGSARMLLHQSRFHSDQRNAALAEGLTRRATQPLADQPTCAEHALLATLNAAFSGLHRQDGRSAQTRSARDRCGTAGG